MDLKKRIITWFVEELVRSKRMENRGTFSMNGKEGKVVGTLVGTAWFLPVAFTPFSTACFSPLHPLFGTVCPFLWPASKLYSPPPPSPRRVQWNSWIVFSRGFTSLSSFDLQPTFFAVEKKNKEKKERNRLFEFFKTYYYEVEKYTLRSFRLSFFLIIVEVISIDSYIYHWKIMESISWNSIKCIARVLEIIKEVCCVT